MNRKNRKNRKNKKNTEKKSKIKVFFQPIIRVAKYIKNNPWRCGAIALIFTYFIVQFRYCEGSWIKYMNRNIRGARLLVRAYYWLLTFRFTVQWFPNINPYIHPLYGLIWATDLFLRQFENFLPSILGIDFSAMCAFACLEWMIQTLDVMSVVVPIDEENPDFYNGRELSFYYN
ncbi:unnamed protein product [Sphacelaria rigidula]